MSFFFIYISRSSGYSLSFFRLRKKNQKGLHLVTLRSPPTSLVVPNLFTYPRFYSSCNTSFPFVFGCTNINTHLERQPSWWNFPLKCFHILLWVILLRDTFVTDCDYFWCSKCTKRPSTWSFIFLANLKFPFKSFIQ